MKELPEDAPRVIVFENEESWVELIKYFFNDLGFNVVAVVDDMQKAVEEIIPLLEQMGVSFALIDSNLTPGEYDGEDGKKIARLIKQHAPSVKTIGFSGSSGIQQEVDIQMGKTNFNKANLRKILFGE